MTLFLGILNYLAEKRGHVPKGKRNHRVVICDNPFGKASSDHVLGPVFHIAKQLGFQMIALTAHAMATDRLKSIEVGCADFDTKPVDFARLLAKIVAQLKEAEHDLK